MSGFTVWKYVWPAGGDKATFEMPAGAEVLHVAAQGQDVCLWARVAFPSGSSDRRRFVLCGTGHPAPDSRHRYVGTALLGGGSLVFHVFEEPYPDA